jgi:hypothetical protein
MYTEWYWRKERSAVARFLAGIWQMRGERGDVDKGKMSHMFRGRRCETYSIGL